MASVDISAASNYPGKRLGVPWWLFRILWVAGAFFLGYFLASLALSWIAFLTSPDGTRPGVDWLDVLTWAGGIALARHAWRTTDVPEKNLRLEVDPEHRVRSGSNPLEPTTGVLDA